MKKIARIFIRLPNWIGDVCMSLSSLNALIDSKAEIVICAKPWAESLLAGYLERPNIRFVGLSGKWHQDAKRLREFRKSYPLPKQEKEVGLILPDSLTSGLTFAMAGIPSAGYKDDGRSPLLKWPINKPELRVHYVTHWFNLTRVALSQWGFACAADAEQRVMLPLTQAQQQACAQYMQEHNLVAGQFILIAPTAVGLNKGDKGKVKVWPHFDELTQHLQANGHEVIMCPPTNEAEQAQTNAPSAHLLPALPLGAFVALLQKAALVVCNDSGVSHMSAAVLAKQISLFGVTHVRYSAPWSPQALTLGDNEAWPSLDEVVSLASEVLSPNHQ